MDPEDAEEEGSSRNTPLGQRVGLKHQMITESNGMELMERANTKRKEMLVS